MPLSTTASQAPSAAGEPAGHTPAGDTASGQTATERAPAARDPGTSRARLPLAPLTVVLGVLLLLSVLCGVVLGASGVPFTDVLRYLAAGLTGGTLDPGDQSGYTIIWDIRFPRAVLAAVVGAGLAVIGVAVQALVRNALADPFVLGISSGAAVGANAVIMFGALAALGVWALSTAAFLSAFAAMVLVYAAARTAHGVTPLRLVLTGTAMSYGFSAVTTVMVFTSAHGEAARSAMLWLLGSLGGATWSSVPIAGCTVLAGTVWLLSQAGRLNALAMGDETAAALGVHPSRLRTRLFIVAAAVTGTVVAVSGAIGFVGLMVPHAVRMVVGADHRRVLVVAPLVGGLLLVWVDVLSRVLFAPAELPIGAITAVLGVPCFVWMMRRRGYAFGGR